MVKPYGLFGKVLGWTVGMLVGSVWAFVFCTLLVIGQLLSRQSALESDENRLRSSIQTLNSVPGQQDQVQRYATDLSKKENEIQAVHARLDDARKRQATLEEELATLVEKLSF